MSAALAFGAAPPTARAGVILTLSSPINGTAPSGNLTATILDLGANTVQLTMSATGLTGTAQYVPNWLFNLTPGWNFGANPLSFNYVSGIQAVDVQAASNAFNGGSNVKGGLFDIEFTFQTSNSGTPPQTRLSAGTTSVYTITGNGLNAAAFANVSVPDGGVGGGYYSAADVRAIPPGGSSGSIGATSISAVPEPSSLTMSLLLGIAMLGRLGWRSWRRSPA